MTTYSVLFLGWGILLQVSDDKHLTRRAINAKEALSRILANNFVHNFTPNIIVSCRNSVKWGSNWIDFICCHSDEVVVRHECWVELVNLYGDDDIALVRFLWVSIVIGNHTKL